MTILEAIANHIEDNELATLGTDLFIGELPLEKENAISVITSPSTPPNPSIGVYEQNVDIWARFNDSGDGYDTLQEISDLFHRQNAYIMGDFYVYLSNNLSAIDDMDRDTERRKLWKLTIRFIYRSNTDNS